MQGSWREEDRDSPPHRLSGMDLLLSKDSTTSERFSTFCWQVKEARERVGLSEGRLSGCRPDSAPYYFSQLH